MHGAVNKALEEADLQKYFVQLKQILMLNALKTVPQFKEQFVI